MSEVLFVGTSDAFGAGGRRQAAILVRAPSGSVLLDCGPTTLTGLAALGVPRDEIDAILISHFHGDHFGGIPLFVLAAVYEDQRRKPLRIIGPEGVRDRVTAAAAGLGHPIEGGDRRYPIEFEEFHADEEIDAGPVRMRAFRARHQDDSRPHGLVVTSGSRRIAYTGDTGWFDALPEKVKGADLLISECTLLERGYEYHLSLEELEDRRRDLACARIVLTHLGPDMAARRGGVSFECADDGTLIRI